MISFLQNSVQWRVPILPAVILSCFTLLLILRQFLPKRIRVLALDVDEERIYFRRLRRERARKKYSARQRTKRRKEVLMWLRIIPRS